MTSRCLRSFHPGERIAPVGPTITRPALRVIERVDWWDDRTGVLYGGDERCDHYVFLARGGGVKCARCPGWYCA